MEEDECEGDLACPVLKVVSVQDCHNLLIILIPDTVTQPLDKFSHLPECSWLFVHFKSLSFPVKELGKQHTLQGTLPVIDQCWIVDDRFLLTNIRVQVAIHFSYSHLHT